MESLHACKRALDAGLITHDDYAHSKDWFLFAHRIASARESGALTASDAREIRHALVRAIHEGAKDVRCDVRGLLDATLRRELTTTMGDDDDEDADADADANADDETGSGGAADDAFYDATEYDDDGGVVKTKFNVKKSAVAQATFMVKIAEKAEEANENAAPNVALEAKVAPPPPPPPPAVLPPTATATANANANANKVDGTSMSGVAVAEDCISVFNKVKLRSSGLQWAVFRVEETEGSVLTDATGAAGHGDYSAFISALPENECRYAIYDYEYVNSEDCVFNKLVFIIWNPDGARLKNKMLYASTKDFFKSRLSGIAVEIQATDLDEVSEEELRTSVGAILTRK
jgi:cofilin